jgi:hypothetical protein
MKKSNILIACASGLALCSILLIGWFAATAINNYRQGKDPFFARSYSQYEEMTITAGKEFSFLAFPRVWDCTYTDLKNGKGIIRFIRLSDYKVPITLRLPEIPSVSIDNISNVNIELLTHRSLRLKCTRIAHLSLMNCKLRTLDIDFPGKMDHQEIFIANCNQIDTLVASVRGSGNLRLEMAGNYKNQVTISDSIKLLATSEIFKKLAKK